MMNTKIGFVILNYKTWERTISCVDSILQTYKEDKVIVVVDNDSPNDSFMRLQDKFDEFKYREVEVIRTKENGGFSKGNNYGFRYVRARYTDIEYIIITNNDILFCQNSIIRLENVLKKNEMAVIAAPLIKDIEGNNTNRPWKNKPSYLQNLGFHKKKNSFFEWSDICSVTQVYMVSGCCFAVNASLFENVGMFDENVFLYNEENILSFRISNSRLKILVDPSACVVHDHGSTTGNGNLFVDKELFKSCVYFWKYYERQSNTSIRFMWIVWLIKTMLKILLKRYTNNSGIIQALKETAVVTQQVTRIKDYYKVES